MTNLQTLAETAKISSSYIDKTGLEHQTTDSIRRFFLNAMGYKANSEQEIADSLKQLTTPTVLPPVLAFYDNESPTFTANKEGKFTAILTNEQDNIVWTQPINGKEETPLPPLPNGYYTLTLSQNNTTIKTLIILAPEFCYQPEYIKNKEHLFGVSLMLYALKSKNSQGIGDFSDLEEIIEQTAANGGDIIGLNPLGVMCPETLPKNFVETLKGDVSPYRTLSRQFINYAYIDLTREEDYECNQEIKAFMQTPEVKAELERLNNSDKVLYRPVLLFKRRVLRMMFNYFKNHLTPERHLDFVQFIAAKGEALKNLCLFEVLLENHPESHFWRHWQDGTADINSAATAAFKAAHEEDILFYIYTHWLADRQLKRAQILAESLGMKIGLYGDMPIGAASNGAEVWENPSAYVLEAGIGAPADPMRPKGQSWGFTPYHPFMIEQQQYQQFIRLVRENMRNFGALRIDHAMGLRRLFWGFFAEGNPVLQGAYIYYDIKALTAILSIESNRTKCLVIGEDLGTVPEGFREYMAAHGLLSYKVFFRQKEKDGTFIKPENYTYMSLAQSSTHDQATSCGFWANEDIEEFKQCGLYVNDEQYQTNLAGRTADRKNLLKALDSEHLLSNSLKEEMQQSVETGQHIPQGIEEPINIYGAKTGSALYLVRLCDIYAQKVLDNAPGTIDEYTNWRIKLNKSIEEIKQTDTFKTALQTIKANRPS
ncbi:MAG: 4-alpha-glucanotransferase [Acetobacter sp.]|nr:4-alpha-glucanotransferase [Acetobacter sp.]